MNKADLFEQADYQLAACSQCGVFFAPAKELEYVLALLEQAGLSGEELEERRALLGICPTCRRKNDIAKLVAAESGGGLMAENYHQGYPARREPLHHPCG